MPELVLQELLASSRAQDTGKGGEVVVIPHNEEIPVGGRVTHFKAG